MSLPTFKYHPDPIATGSVKQSDAVCECCGQRRGFIYTGPVYCVRGVVGVHLPVVHRRRFGPLQVRRRVHRLGGHRQSLPHAAGSPAVVEEVAFRTPGFSGWQQERWLACCRDAAAFVRRAGYAELQSRFPDAIESIRTDSEMGERWPQFFEALSSEDSPTAYVFRCLHCGTHVGYADYT